MRPDTIVHARPAEVKALCGQWRIPVHGIFP